MNGSNQTGRIGHVRPIRMAAGVLCGVGMLHAAIAGPPVGRLLSPTPPTPTARFAPLDLRAPGGAGTPAGRRGAGAPASEPFPSANQRHELGAGDLGGEDRRAERGLRSSAAGDDAMSMQNLSQGQIIAQRIQRMRREGLPLARLWESKSAAVSLGLNQRGKPGLWFTQRMH